MCGMMNSMVIEPQFRIDNFNGYFDSEGNPLDTLVLDTNRIYSPDLKFYLDYSDKIEFKDKRVKLYNQSGKMITKIRGVSKYEHITWLDNCVIFNGGSAPEPRKVIVDLTSGKTKTFKTKGWFMYIGQTNSKAYYVPHTDYQKIGNLKVKSRHSIIELDEKSQRILYDNESVEGRYLWNGGFGLRFRWYSYSKDTVNFFEYYNPQLAIKCTKLDNKSDDDPPLNVEFIVNDTVRFRTNDIETLFADVNTLFANGKTYVLIDGHKIYISDGKNLEELIDLEDTEPKGFGDFKIYGKYIVFTQLQGYMFLTPEEFPDEPITINGLETNFDNYGHSVIGLLDLETKEVFYPAIKYK